MPDQHFKALPKPHTTYANIIKSLLPIGDHDKLEDLKLPEATYSIDNLTIDFDNLTDYRKICGFSNNSFVPPTYFSVLSLSLQMTMMVKEAFPFSLLGLMHVCNSVTQYRPVSDTSIFRMTVCFDNLREHERGKQFDFVTKVYEKEQLVWQGQSTYLSRQKVKKTEPTPRPTTTPPEKPLLDENDMHHFWEVAEDIGRRYAFVSGDFNLIHLHPLSARAFGFPKAIAHGMWTKAKCLAEIGDLPPAFVCHVDFLHAVLLPSEVEFIAKYDNRDETIDFGVYDSKSPKLYLSGKLEEFSR